MDSESLFAPYALKKNTLPDPEDMEMCHVDGDYYSVSDMFYDNEFSHWVAKINLEDYCLLFKQDMTSEEYNQFKNKLENKI